MLGLNEKIFLMGKISFYKMLQVKKIVFFKNFELVRFNYYCKCIFFFNIRMGNYEIYDLVFVRDDERKEFNLSRKVIYKQFCKVRINRILKLIVIVLYILYVLCLYI